MKFIIKNRFSGKAQFTAEIDCAGDASTSIKLGLAIKWAVANRANLSGADLIRADLSGANLSGAGLLSADLIGADMIRADLSGANLSGAKDADYAIARMRILPDGDLIVWKKCTDGVIVKLKIPETAKRSHAFGRKCRAEFADVLEVIGAEFGIGTHDDKTEYRVGQRVTPDKW